MGKALARHKAIKPHTLFWPYIVLIPAVFLLTANAFFSLHLSSLLPTAPNKVLLLGVFFENPHIVASGLIWLDKEYIQNYRTLLITKLSITACLCGLALVLNGLGGLLLLFYSWTVWHVIQQQIGIGRMMNQEPSNMYEVWGWLFLLSSLLVAAKIGFPGVVIGERYEALFVTSIILSISITSAVCIGRIITGKTRHGKQYIALNTAMMLTSAISILSGLPFIAILIPRIVHDTTAYIIYVNHDQNRNADMSRNLLYRYTLPYFSVAVVCIVVSLSLAAFVTFTPTYIAFYTGVALALFHYSTEAFVWKRGSLHRQSLRFGTIT